MDEKKTLHLLRLNSKPIHEQLQIEEALLRVDTRNWCILNTGSNAAIVLGISGDPAQLIHEPTRAKLDLPMIRRFSGGGTVVVDRSTCFTTFIMNAADVGSVRYPPQIMDWTASVCRHAFEEADFKVLENDFVIGNRKCGGNAQYLCKDRWLQHTSFLWDYCSDTMQSLLLPKKIPEYRQQRMHDDFLCRLCDRLPYGSPNGLLDKFEQTLESRFKIIWQTEEDVAEIIQRPHRKATVKIEG